MGGALGFRRTVCPFETADPPCVYRGAEEGIPHTALLDSVS